MKKYIIPTGKFFLGVMFLFFLFTVVKAQDVDYELIIITPEKFDSVAQDFLKLHDDGVKPWTIRGVYATVEEIVARYDGLPDDGPEEPSPAAAPPVPSPTQDDNGFNYPPDLNPLPNMCIVKFLRGILELPSELDVYTAEGREEFLFAFDVLRDKNGNLTGFVKAKFKYLFLLGDTGAAGGGVMTYNGVPESWYLYINDDTYGEETGPDRTIFPTDFFYASPDYNNGMDDADFWIPNLAVGRIPVHDFDPAPESGEVTEINTIDEEDITNPYNIAECDVCDSAHAATLPWDDGGDGMGGTPGEWAGYELWIVSDGNPPDDGTAAPIGATYLILDNSETCLRVLGDPEADGLEEETPDPDPLLDIDGDGYEIHDDGLDEAQDIYNKCAAYDAAVKTAGAWNNWYRKVVTAGGDSHPGLFSFWDEFVLADITNQGFFEGNELIKLRHTNKDNVPVDDDFTLVSFAPYLDGTSDCGLIFHLGDAGEIDTGLIFDDGILTSDDVLGYVSADSSILPIMVSNAGGVYSGYYFGAALFDRYVDVSTPPAFGAAAVESPDGGAIAFIGATDTTYSGIIPFFDNGVLYQDRLFNMDELLSYTMESFHSAPIYIGDIFVGSPDLLSQGGGPINQFIANNPFETNNRLYWFTEKTLFEYTLLGDPVLPVPYPQYAPIETATVTPSLAFNENSLRDELPLYESHGIAVDEIPTGGVIDTTVNITARDGFSRTVPEVKITLIDIRRDAGEDYEEPGNVPYTYDLDPIADDPGYYFIKVEQPGWNGNSPGSGSWGNAAGKDWWEKETWIYVQEVNEFTVHPSRILVVDDDFGYPIVTNPTFSWIDGYEDWYLNTLDILGQAYDIWHVDFDDDATRYVGGADDWNGVDQGDALMHGEVYQSLLNNYDKVVWLTGDSYGYWRPSDFLYPTQGVTIFNIETITALEQQYLQNYLDNGGNLFLSGQGILRDLGCQGLTEEDAADRFCERKQDSFAIQNEFLTDYMHITDLYSAVTRGYHPLIKNVLIGNPIISGTYTIDIAGEDGAENQYAFTDAEPDTSIVVRVFEYASLSGAPEDIGEDPFWGTTGTAHYQGCGAHVFLPWGFEAIDNQTNRNEVMAAILSWLNSPTLTGPYLGCLGYCGNGVCEPGRGENETTCPADCADGGGGGGGGVGSLKGCFIATACYGTPMAEEVQVLSSFRDEYLLNNSLGRIFVENYYKFSPQISEYISKHPILKYSVRGGLKPLVGLCEKLVK